MSKTDTYSVITQLKTFKEPKTRFDLRLSHICTFGIGGTADAVLSPESEQELTDTLLALKRHSIPVMTVGSASNILFSDQGFRGAVIRTHRLNSISLNDGKLTCQAGAFLPTLCRFAARNGIGGFHGLCGIPGTVGGALVTAAGAFGCNIYDTLESCRVFIPKENQIADIPCRASDFSYRKSPFSLKDDLIILSATFKPTHEDNAVILEKIHQCTQKRFSSQPHGERSAGSYFKRPPDAPPAAYLIDKARLKGLTVGGAAVSEKHAGFIINKGNATAKDVLTLADTVKTEVFRIHGVKLTEEVIYVNETI